ncbi:MAG: UDP-N-acetylmuramoyl-tripeptide--D-alanyl-D-alanine ligase [Clostridiales bacterium]|nr:UDP-N-acetylmuramoyl-tripeptide--D-alanyl-D-alanine ligase [Clostridiales bacterium]
MQMTAYEIAAACSGRILCGDPQTVITSVSTDSRKVTPGALFVPIRGERTDAHAYIPATFAAGAAATLTQNHSEMQDNHVWIAVPDTVEALRRIAAAYRSRFNIPVIGVTGSVGKTTTKEMVALALSARWNTMKTEGNQNSQVGLPLTMFRLEPEHEVAVIEMGMSDFGEMGRLAQIARPQYAVMTNIGVSHIQQLGTQENILAEKLHITDAFLPGSILFLNGDDPHLAGLRNMMPAVRKVWFGMAPWCDYRAEQVERLGDGMRFTAVSPFGSLTVELPVPGVHNVRNALAGLAVTKELGGDLREAAEALASYRPLAMRQQIHRTQGGLTVIDDSYNASPDAIYSSLEVLGGFSGRRVAVLADMLELGAIEKKAHEEVGLCAARGGVSLLVTVGERAKWIAEGAQSYRNPPECRSFATNEEAIAFLHNALKSGDVVLVKGSRGMRTDEIVKGLL